MLSDPTVVESILELPYGADMHVRGSRCYVTVKGLPCRMESINRLFATSERLLEAAQKVAAR